MAVRQLPDGRWICYYRVRGSDGKSRQKREFFGRGAQGEAKARARENSLLSSRSKRPEQSRPAFGDLAAAYAGARGFSENSLYNLNIRLKASILPFFQHRAAARLSHQDMDDYVLKRRKQGVSSATIVREITDIQAILNWAEKRRPRLIPFNPLRGYPKPKEENAVIAPPTSEELRWIVDAAECHLVRAIFLSYYLGLRPGAVELLRLAWDDYDIQAGYMLVTSSKKGGPVSRRVPVHPDFAPVLERWGREDKGTGPIVHYRGRAVKSLKKAWRGALTRAGITRRLRMYDLRHGFVTTALEQGADIKALAEIVGSNPETLRRHYQHVTTELHRQIITKIPGMDPD